MNYYTNELFKMKRDADKDTLLLVEAIALLERSRDRLLMPDHKRVTAAEVNRFIEKCRG